MSDSKSHGKTVSGHPQKTYLRCLHDEDIPLKNRPYYVTRVKQFVSASSSRDPVSLDQPEIERILTSFGRSDDLQDWQFAQLVDAYSPVKRFCVWWLNGSRCFIRPILTSQKEFIQAQAEVTAYGRMFGMASEVTSNVIKSVGDGLTSIARKN